MKKEILAVVGVGVLAIGYYSYKKYKVVKAIIQKLVVRPKDIKDVKLSLKKISFTISLELINNTHFDLGFTTGSIITLNNVKIYTPTGHLLADIKTNVSSLEIPAYGSYTITDLHVEMQTHSLLTQFDKMMEYIATNSLLYELTIVAFGKEFSIAT
ncbi:hypothetical protein IMCC3317_11050 [Kordia antarctica]|uniref:Late embryogenesis abundant protein LEA-2 subgroup domain-containing protein n=1 Tax=Kordia antarctica TaxID=1218801 RepID=A0A7L4ZH22_9FLAO|nr:hypothetical protein [Kordia antarctica]QHI35757.1 hypothetical protein IMCC3317_11050 [Kordia antarctica]